MNNLKYFLRGLTFTLPSVVVLATVGFLYGASVAILTLAALGAIGAFFCITMAIGVNFTDN